MFCMAKPKTLSGVRQQIPGGAICPRFAYYGPDEEIERSLQSFIQMVEQTGMRAVGDVYVIDLMTVAFALSDENCLLNFWVKVE